MTVQPRPGLPAGVYVHIPFCDRLCPYCDFAVAIRKAEHHQPYVDALWAEFDARRHELAGRDVRTLYVGGGTPSALRVELLEAVLVRMRETWPDAVEFTVEVNPNHVTVDFLARVRAAGVTRVSLGVQSFDDDYLRRLGRTHTGDGARRAAELALEVLGNVSVDLIVGGPGHSMDALDRDLDVIASIGVPHVSVYELTVEETTVFGKLSRRGALERPDEDLGADLLMHAARRLGAAGIEQYEVSNYARRGFESLHNMNYWAGGEYLGLGLGAHSLTVSPQLRRRANVRHLKTYIAAPLVEAETELLSAREHLSERLFVGLRARPGVNLEELRGQGLVADEAGLEALMVELVATGLIQRNDQQVWPTERGYWLTNEIANFVARM